MAVRAFGSGGSGNQLEPGTSYPNGSIVNCTDKHGNVDNYSTLDNTFEDDSITHRQMDSTGRT